MKGFESFGFLGLIYALLTFLLPIFVFRIMMTLSSIDRKLAKLLPPEPRYRDVQDSPYLEAK